MLFAHRGDTSVAPENTIEAIRAATAWADGVEIDVWHEPDGTFRLAHDGPLLWEELPSLDQAASAAGNMLIQIDLKDTNPTVATALAEWIVSHGLEARSAISVKTLPSALAVRAAAPRLTIVAPLEVVPAALGSPDVDIVGVWGPDWCDALRHRPASQLALYTHASEQTDRWGVARRAGVNRYLSDGPH